jgi:uncharacterized protein (TIGR02722 family)
MLVFKEEVQMRVIAVWCVVGLAVLACSAGKTVTRVDATTTTDFSEGWNDTDSRNVAQTMIQDCLNRPWIGRHSRQSGGEEPVVIVGPMRNKTMEHIAIDTFVKDIEREFINSGFVRVVATQEERGSIRGERDDQAHWADEESAKQMGRELGADYMLTGVISQIEDRGSGEKAVFFQTDMTLINIETNEKIWSETHKIKKIVSRGRYRP